MDLFAPEHRRDPYPTYAAVRAATPVVHVPDARSWVVLGYDAVKRVLTDHAVFRSDAAPARGQAFEWLLFMDPPRHTRLRALIGRAFTSRAIAALEPVIRRLAEDRIAATIDRGEIDVVAELATPVPMMVIAALIGLPADDWPMLARWSEAIVQLGNTIVGGDGARAGAVFAAADVEMAAYFRAAIAVRRTAPRDDLLTRLVTAEVDGELLAEHELIRFCQLLLVAGTETTTNVIDNALVCFAEHPDQLARVRADPALLAPAVEEVLRVRTPVQAMFRATAEPVELDGVAVPAGAFVIAMIGAANRDPRRFPAPDAFDIGRTPNPHLAFGHGIHFCVGAPLARLEATIVLDALLRRWASFELADPAWPSRPAFHVHGPSALRILFTARAA